MKFTFLVITLVVFSLVGFSQSKKELQEQIKTLNTEKSTLQDDKTKLGELILELKQQILDLKTENLDCRNANETLQSQISSAPTSNSNNVLGITSPSSSSSTTKRCLAITAKGTQCTREAESGSDYCWQHKSTYEPYNVLSTKSSSSSTYKATSSPSSASGRTLITGPRGGTYYINSKGNKTYVKKK